MNIHWLPEIKIPIIIAANDYSDKQQGLLDLIQTQREELMAIIHEHGAILLRGFACDNADFFSQAIKQCDLGSRCTTSDYAIARTLLANDIYTSSDLPGDIPLPLHHEKPRSNNPPDYLYFCCMTPAEQGGETLFADAAAIWQDMPETIKKKISTYGVLYRQFYHAKRGRYQVLKNVLPKNCLRTWSDHFSTLDRQFIEAQLAQEEGVSWEWQKGDLIVNNQLPGVRHHPVTGKELWFNSAEYLNFYHNTFYGCLHELPMHRYWAVRYLMVFDALPNVCHYGNGQPFLAQEIADIRAIIKRNCWMLPWQKGDFMIVDNLMLMHGKKPHSGDRLLYSCMTKR